MMLSISQPDLDGAVDGQRPVVGEVARPGLGGTSQGFGHDEVDPLGVETVVRKEKANIGGADREIDAAQFGPLEAGVDQGADDGVGSLKRLTGGQMDDDS
jgi:hypothetical protein